MSKVPGRLKAKGTTYWENDPDIVPYVSNITGFTGLGSGLRDGYSSTGFGWGYKFYGFFWTKTDASKVSVLRFSHSSINPKIDKISDKTDGYTVRLVTTRLFDIIP